MPSLWIALLALKYVFSLDCLYRYILVWSNRTQFEPRPSFTSWAHTKHAARALFKARCRSM